MAPRVVNCRKEKFDIYIGRPTVWGNPFSHRVGTLARFRVATVEEAVESYERWLMEQPELVARVKRELKGMTLGCFGCKPRCHGEVLLRVANE